MPFDKQAVLTALNNGAATQGIFLIPGVTSKKYYSARRDDPDFDLAIRKIYIKRHLERNKKQPLGKISVNVSPQLKLELVTEAAKIDKTLTDYVLYLLRNRPKEVKNAKP